MPHAHPTTCLLKNMAQVHLDTIEQAWAVGYNQLPPYSRVCMRLDNKAYDIFRRTANKPWSGPLAHPERTVEAYFYVTTDSSVDIINLDTLNRLGYLKESLIEPSREGRNLFREANMSLKGAIFAELGFLYPTTQNASYTSSLVYVADCDKNHLSASSVDALKLRTDKSLGDLNPLYIPNNN